MSWVVSGVSRAPTLFQIAGAPDAAYSLRQLDLTDKNVVRVRRSGDDAESNFTAAQVIASGASGLAGWVDAGGGTKNGFVTTWYDQSVGGRNLTQTTNASQPQIVNNGALIIDEQSKPTIKFNNHRLNGQVFPVVYMFYVLKLDDAVSTYNCITNRNGATGFSVDTDASFTVRVLGSPEIITRISTVGAQLIRRIYTSQLVPGNYDLFRNGTNSVVTQRWSTDVLRDTASTLPLMIGQPGVGSGGTGMKGEISELIVYSSNQSANRVAIETNMNSYYAIY